VAPSWAGATVDQSLLSPQSLCANSGNDGRDELQSMLDRVRKLKGYSYDSILTTYTGGKKVVEIGRLYFKSPNLVRFEVIKSGSRSGAVVVKQADGKIRGQMGGLFRGIKVTLSPDSKILKSANGFSIMQADLESLLSDVAKKARGDLRCLAVGPGSGRPAVVEILESDGDVEDRIAVDSRAKLPSEWSIFNGNKLVSALQLKNLEERNNLSDDLFTFSGEGESKSLNPVSLSAASGLGALQASPNRPIDAATCNDIERLIKQMAYLCDKMPSEVAQGDGWIDGMRELVLSTCAELEVLQYELRPVIGAIDNSKGKAGIAGGAGCEAAPNADSIATQWNTAAASLHAALDQLLDQLSDDQSDSAVVKKAASDLKSSVKSLRAASDRIQDLISVE
ncbi:MAG: outer membrane lipoprotein carrier protein LolA, partial [Candidatus Melainabacteria bacterium]|nr:outer membrane lipoprotein carrier protein LolA [Candidatus Melainabacteria bacterium]